jgi:hypothetical protein
LDLSWSKRLNQEGVHRALSVGIGQGRALNGQQPQVVEPLRLSLELLGDISQTGDACKLGANHGRELLPSVEAAELTTVVEPVAFDPVENIAINKVEQLPENCVGAMA